MGQTYHELSPEARARLALKGRILYGKFCGTDGKGICAESFAIYHIWRGESEVARDLLAFLETEVVAFRDHDPDGRLPLAVELAARIRRHLEAEGDDPPDPSLRASILKAKKRTEDDADRPGAIEASRTRPAGESPPPQPDHGRTGIEVRSRPSPSCALRRAKKRSVALLRG